MGVVVGRVVVGVLVEVAEEGEGVVVVVEAVVVSRTQFEIL